MHNTENFLTYTLPQPIRVVGELLTRAAGVQEVLCNSAYTIHRGSDATFCMKDT